MRLRPSLQPSAVIRSEELRFALVMNGGVSLAVWMGGVSFEINRLVRETHPVFRGVLELTQTSARVDVISGTSAGGVNGAALALAQVYDRSVYSLRDVWMERGAFGRLLRNPAEANPRSLLDGDGYYLPALEEAFAALAEDDDWRVPPDVLPIDLTLTATMLRGALKQSVDDLGAAIQDAAHRTTFGFVRAAPRGTDPAQDAFATPRHIDLLARAARTTSSFPIAFEPVFWKSEDFDGLPGVRAAVHGSRYLVDGGLVDNKPFDAALDAIFHMPGRGNVRRVLAYVAPDPSVSAAVDDDASDVPPLMAEVASRSLIGIPSSQSITEQLGRIRDHNRNVHRRRDALVGLARFHTPAELAALATALFPVYRYRRVHGVIDLFVQRVEDIAAATAAAVAGDAAYETQVGRKTIGWLRSALEEDDQWCGERVPQDAGTLTRTLTDAAPCWEWGLYTVEFLAQFMFDLLRRVQRLRYVMPESANAPPDVAPWPQAAAGDWEEIDDRRTWPPNVATPERVAGLDDPVLGELWRRAFDIAGRLESTTRKDRHRVSRWAGSLMLRLLAEPAREHDEQQLVRRARVTAAAALHFRRDPARDHRRQWNALALEIGGVLAALAGPVAQVAAGTAARALSMAERDFWRELEALASALEIGTGTPADIVRAGLRFEVIHYSMSHRERGANMQVELVQISANSKSPLADEARAAYKLAGMQLAHFGAFYKSAWRANDWMMGRLDGVERLLRVALNPERLYRLYAGRQFGAETAAASVARHVREIALAGTAADVRRKIESAADLALLREELGFLDHVGSRIPETLPRCCELLTRRMHLEIVHAEMPLVARCARDDETAGADAQGVASQLANQVLPRGVRSHPAALSLDHAVALFRSKRVGSERLRDEIGSDLFTKTIAQTVAVTHAAAAGEASGLALSMRAFLKSLGVPILLFYWLAGRLIGGSRTSAAIGAAALAVALIMGVVALMLPAEARKDLGTLLTFSWMLLGVCLLILLLRAPMAFFVLIAAVALPAALHYAGLPQWALAAGIVEVIVAWQVLRLRGLRGLGSVIVILVAALVLFGDGATQDTLAGTACLARAPAIARLGALLDWAHFPSCDTPRAIAVTLPILLAFLLFFATVAGFVRRSPTRAFARWWRRQRA